ncbi:MAG TPA: SMC-Scp complex subunit ScpB [Candidatus Eisenbacteria bacterium]|nr:SMC-Scp complex subunit ScpB [Candidatus Eisenbacteria bacterium]
MPPSNLKAALEALLFSSDEPLSLSLLAESLDAASEDVARELLELDADYRVRGAGVELREIAGGHLLVTAPEHAEWVGRLLRGRKRVRLSRAALETMAIVAYKQPVTKAEVEAIRGVDSSAVLATLLERNLITIRGRSKVVGRPLLYGSTSEFLDYFGLKDLTELPRPEELRALVAAREPEQMDMIELQVPADLAETLPEGAATVDASDEGEMAEEAEEFDEPSADESEESEPAEQEKV